MHSPQSIVISTCTDILLIKVGSGALKIMKKIFKFDFNTVMHTDPQPPDLSQVLEKIDLTFQTVEKRIFYFGF